MSYLCDLLFFFGLIPIVFDYVASLKQTRFFVHFLEYLLFFDDSVDEESE